MKEFWTIDCGLLSSAPDSRGGKCGLAFRLVNASGTVADFKFPEAPVVCGATSQFGDTSFGLCQKRSGSNPCRSDPKAS